MQIGDSQHCYRSFVALAAPCLVGKRRTDHRHSFSSGSNTAGVVPWDVVAATLVLHSLALGRYYGAAPIFDGAALKLRLL